MTHIIRASMFVMLVVLCIFTMGILGEIKQIKHMVNEVICTTLEMEETWESQ